MSSRLWVSALLCSAAVLPWRWGTVPDGLALGDVPLGHLGCKVTAAVGTLDVVRVLHGGNGGQLRGVSPFGDDLLDLPGLAEGADEGLVLLSPVVLGRRLNLCVERRVIVQLGVCSISFLCRQASSGSCDSLAKAAQGDWESLSPTESQKVPALLLSELTRPISSTGNPRGREIFFWG